MLGTGVHECLNAYLICTRIALLIIFSGHNGIRYKVAPVGTGFQSIQPLRYRAYNKQSSGRVSRGDTYGVPPKFVIHA